MNYNFVIEGKIRIDSNEKTIKFSYAKLQFLLKVKCMEYKIKRYFDITFRDLCRVQLKFFFDS